MIGKTNSGGGGGSGDSGAVTISVSTGANGTASPIGENGVLKGGDLTVTFTANSGYRMGPVYVDGDSVGIVSTYTFSNVQENHSIMGTFRDNPKLTASAGPNGSISPSGVTKVAVGGSQKFTITPNGGYRVDDVLVDGSSVGAVTTYTFSNVTDDHTISVTFKPNPKITASAGANGSISPSGTTSVSVGGSQTYTMTPNSGYSVDKVLVDGVSVGEVGTYTFSNVTADHTISVTFKESPIYGYTIDMSKSSPSECITYTDGAASMTQAQRKAWAYSMVTPTVVKNGVINYKLNRANLAQKESGGASDLTGTDGDVCASISPMWFKISKSGKVITVKLSTSEQTGYISAHKFGGQFKQYVHIGMFEATGSKCNSIYSTSTTPDVSKTLNTFRSEAQTKNDGLSQAVYSPVTYLTWTLWQALFIMAYGTLDSQSAVGNGISSASKTAIGRAELLTCSGEYGTTANQSTHCMALFVVNPWANVYEFRDGCMANGSEFAVLTDQKDLYNIESGWSGKPSSWHVVTGCPTSSNYVTEFKGDAYAGFYPAAVGGPSSTYACDYCYSNSNTNRCCCVGGRWAYGADCGAFCVNAKDAASNSYSDFGARLQALNLT